jgi:hypothetical protein
VCVSVCIKYREEGARKREKEREASEKAGSLNTAAPGTSCALLWGATKWMSHRDSKHRLCHIIGPALHERFTRFVLRPMDGHKPGWLQCLLGPRTARLKNSK